MAFSEADTRAKLIDPALHRRGWSEELIRREETAGAVEIVDGRPRRSRRKRVDYVLRIKAGGGRQLLAIALIEAKKESLPAEHGLEQAKQYARKCERLQVRFAFSSNGHQFVEFDLGTGQTRRPQPMRDFPTPADLRRRYEQQVGFGLDDAAAKPLLTPYHGGEGKRRYYQDAAIRAVLEKLAWAEAAGAKKRALLSLATGTGKTFIAVHLLKRIADAGQLRRALFLCDRDELRAQAQAAFYKVFGAEAAEVRRAPDGSNTARNARVQIATYQTLGVSGEDGEDADADFLNANFPEGAFSHIVIDECHRSAWNKWHEVLRRNPDAAQIGLTATPRKFKEGGQGDTELRDDNFRYFGEPAYDYTIGQAMDDGYLAACDIRKSEINLDISGIDQKAIVERGPRHAVTGQPLSEDQIREHYDRQSFEATLLLPDRVQAMCVDLFASLLQRGGPEQKTIVFCIRDAHADAVAAQMNNLYARWCAQHGKERAEPYAFKCTASVHGNEQLPDLRGSTKHHFIATTVDLLTTGVDVLCVRNIVFFRYIRSPISFYQMLGRGTRIDEANGKLQFTVHDYTNATDLLGEDIAVPKPRTASGGPEGPGEGGEPPPLVEVDGFQVAIRPEGRYVLIREGGAPGEVRRITAEEYQERMAARLVELAPGLDELRRLWIAPPERRALIDGLRAAECHPGVLRALREMHDYDDYDLLAETGYGMAPLTRALRAGAFDHKNAQWLQSLPTASAEAIRAITGQFAQEGTEGLENPHIFDLPALRQAGGPHALQQPGQSPRDLLRKAKKRLFAA